MILKRLRGLTFFVSALSNGKALHNNSAPEYLVYPAYTFSISYVSSRLNQFLSPSCVIGANIEKPLYSIITPKYLSECLLVNP